MKKEIIRINNLSYKVKDGDEEKTHLCIRFFKGNDRFLTVYESNHYGLTLKSIVDYLNEQFKLYNEDLQEKYYYSIEYEAMPGEDFLSAIKKSKTTSVLKLTVSKEDIKDDFMKFAGRTDIADEIEEMLAKEGFVRCRTTFLRARGGDLLQYVSVRCFGTWGQPEIDVDMMPLYNVFDYAGRMMNAVITDEGAEGASLETLATIIWLCSVGYEEKDILKILEKECKNND